MSQNLRVAELDFDAIKANLKAYLSSKPGFTDHNYEGSGLSLMMDVLAYNTHYNAVIANMLTQEMFLDSAVKRATIGLHAKRMGYLPRSYRAARSFVNVEVFPDTSPPTLTLGKNAVFSSSGLIQFDFVTLDIRTIKPTSDGKYIFENIPIIEGSPKTFKYLVGTDHQHFVIPSKNIDTTTLRVGIQKSSTNTDLTVFNSYDSIVDVNGQTNAFFLRTNEVGMYEVYFGDGVIGKSIEPGNVVHLEYIVCNGDVPNGATGFRLSGGIQGFTNINTTTLNRAFGGGNEESLQSIKDNSYRQLLAQNRAVTESDYKVLINSILPIGDVSVWGGEHNNPPMYGKVFLSVIPVDINAVFDDTTKQYIMDHMRNKMTVTITPELVDPDYTYVSIDTTAYYDNTMTNHSPEDLKTILTARMSAYATTYLNKFGAALKYSQLLSYIDASDKSIRSNITKLKLRKKLPVFLSSTTSYRTNFKNPIRPGTLTTGAFTDVGYNGYVYLDDLDGIVREYTLVDGVKNVIKNVGTINYTTGEISILPIMITSYTDTVFSLSVIPASNDIISITNDVLILNAVDVTVNVIEEPKYKTNYVFTNSV